jgi:hypothetical protein
MSMKKGSRRKQNNAKSKSKRKPDLDPAQIQRVHKARKKLRKNPAFEQFKGKLPDSLIDAACDMTVLHLLKTFGVSTLSLLNVMVPIAIGLLEKNKMSTTLPLGTGLSVTLERIEPEKEKES